MQSRKGREKDGRARDDRSDFTARAWGVGRTEEGLLRASSFCCESAKGPPVALLLGYGPSSSQQRICATRPCEILRSAVPASHPLSPLT